MLQIVVVMRESRSCVVGRVDVDALYPPGVKRQQCLQSFQIVPLNQHVGGIAIPRRKPWNILKEPILDPPGGPDVLLSGQPVQSGHGLKPTTDAVITEK